jgi:hypothetical protein
MVGGAAAATVRGGGGCSDLPKKQEDSVSSIWLHVDNQFMRIGEILRYARPKDPGPFLKDGVPNFWHVTHTPGETRAQLEAGIDAIKEVKSPDGWRVPAVMLSSSPHKVGSDVTPWQDTIDPDVGYALYYGDSRAIHPHAPGNGRQRRTTRRI